MIRPALHAQGTRVRLFPELFAGYAEPETAFLSPAPGSVRAGPADDQMYVANPLDKRLPYTPPDYMPPFRGEEYAPAMPDRGGHFDTIPVEAPQFLAAHIYGGARHTLDIWEHYLGQRVRWWHAPEIPQLELVPVVDWANAHSGPGFMETGMILNDQHREHLFCLNFDVVAHEIGHAVLFAIVGVPGLGQLSSEYLAFHESFSDLFGLIGVLRFQSVIERLLYQTGGNLHALNMLNRLGRYSENQQVRLASNTSTMAELEGVRLRPDGNWDDPTGQNRNQHALGEPLTGAIFDMLVEIFQGRLVSRGLINRDMDARDGQPGHVARALPVLHRHYSSRLNSAPAAFAEALLEARDIVGYGMANAMHRLHPETLDFNRVAACILESTYYNGERANFPALLQLFLRRGIDPRPFISLGAGHVSAMDDDNRRTRAGLSRDPDAYANAYWMVRSGHRSHAHPPVASTERGVPE